MSRLVLSGVRVVGGTDPVSACTVVIEGTRISAVVPDAFNAEDDDRVVELPGHWVMPGMATCHFHTTYHQMGSARAPFGEEYPPPYQGLIAAENLRTALRWGYTSTVGANGANDVDGSVAQALADGFFTGPRFIPCSRGLATTDYGNAAPWNWSLPATGSGGVRICDGEDGFRHAVRAELARGARVIKLFVTGAHGGSVPSKRTVMTRPELAAAVGVAHAHGALVRGHIANKRAILMAIDVGVDILDYCDDLDDEIVRALAGSSTFINPCLMIRTRRVRKLASERGEPAARACSELALMAAALPEADAAGVRILLGDDYGTLAYPHGAYGAELDFYVHELGVAPGCVLGWATRQGAAVMGSPDDLGAVAPGRLADLVVLDSDPTIDISVLSRREPVAVLKDGTVVAGRLS